MFEIFSTTRDQGIYKTNIFLLQRRMTIHISQAYRDSISEGPTYLINTGKVIKGHKTTLKQNVRKMVMKSRHCSRTSHSIQNTSRDSEFKEGAKYTEYTEKYRALDTIDDQDDLLRFILYQRGKESSHNKRALKLFSRPPSSQKPNSGRLFSAQTPRSSITRQSNRTSLSNRSSLTKTISYEIHNSLNDFSVPESKVAFTTMNIDSRMNQYLNLILQSKEKGDMHIDEDQIRKKHFQLSNKKISAATPTTSQPQYQRLANNFFKKMKKQGKAKPETNSDASIYGSEELVKSLKRTFRQFEQMERNYEGKSGRPKVTRTCRTAHSQAGSRSTGHPSFILSPQTVRTPISTSR